MMNIDYILQTHGVGMSSGSPAVVYESVKNLTASSSYNEGAQILVTWTNPTEEEFVKVELFTSTSDLANLDYEQTVLNSTKVIDGTENTYLKSVEISTTHYFKAYVTYLTFGETKISKGVSTFATATDTTPPNPITNFIATKGNAQIALSWTNPTNSDFAGVKILRQTSAYPTSTSDGIVVYNGIGTTYTDTSLDNDTAYYYRAFTYDTSNNYNDTETGQEVSATPQAYVVYGVKIDTLNSNPSSALVYTDNAVGFTPAQGNNGSFNAGSWADKFPFNAIKPCLYKNGAVNYYLNPNYYTQKLDGSVSDITSGTDGDVMVEFPKIWWKFETVGTDLYIRYSDAQVDANYKCLAHMRGTIEKDKCYISAYLGYSLSSKLRSLSFKIPTANQTIGAFRTLAQANGSGYDQIAYYQILMLQVLFVVMFKSRDSQTALGRGCVDGNNYANNTGGANSKGMFYGETTGKLQNKFCGIEDFYGNVYYWIDGFFSDANRNMLIANQSFNDTGSGYTNFGVGTSTYIRGYISAIQGGTETGFIVKASEGSATTHYCDDGSLLASRLPYFGGYCASADRAGAFFLQVDNSPSTANAIISARLLAL